MNITNQCRVCLTEHSDLESMFGTDGKLVIDLYLVTGVKIVEINDKTNALICKKCTSDLYAAKEFRKRCKTSDEAIKLCYQSTEKDFWDEHSFSYNALDSNNIKTESNVYQSIKVEPDDSDDDDDYTWQYDDKDPTYMEVPLDPESLKTLSCPYCSKRLMTARSLKYHIQVKHEKSSSGHYECDYCGKTFPNKHPLKRHINQAHLSTSNKYVVKSDTDMACILCKVVLKNRKSYRNHVKNKHTKWLDVLFPKIAGKVRPTIKLPPEFSEELPCSVCGKIFKNKRNLSQHEKTHIKLLPHEYFYCDLCGNKFKEKILMWSHIKRRHIQKIRYQCDLCPCNYTTNHSLQIHIKVRHKNIRDWICNWCGKDFGEKKKLVAHERIHTGEQPYHCLVCDAKFTHQTDYRRHKWNHEGRKSFKCQICGEGFVKRSELMSHKNRMHAWRNVQQFNNYPQNLPVQNLPPVMPDLNLPPNMPLNIKQDFP